MAEDQLTKGMNRSDGESFVLRLWLESTGGDSPDWRWQVHHVQSGLQRYFGELADVLDFVAERAKVQPPQNSHPLERT